MECSIVNTLTNITTWTPVDLIDATHGGEGLAVILLNRPILLHKEYFRSVWNNATIRVAVDGGTNRWVDFVKNQVSADEHLKPPDLVTGDFDSCTDESMAYVTRLNCTIIKTPDQNATDFTKSLKALQDTERGAEINRVLVLCESSGRLDQIMANINTLFLARSILPNAFVFLRSSNSLSWLLPAGNHRINIPPRLVHERIWCALIPIGNRAVCSTSGLRWNLNDRVVEFGSLVSTSNTYSDEEVNIRTDSNLLWTMGTTPKDM
ncbi:thiamin pyrophosphokinase 1 isoform X2 [Toxorhynchites rutilus septentrionalis]|uniref:thiamin pyrophosphokinase 1 isoform X2 n=1 Tax=Toxorhynchites rutilus septentrionalis TaxID=329112 RepID=UPI00247AF92F|nr:thiamin pyrophosphokinase 1 isoform X2 [Toxorhynchites rutilus septentrionalis]